MAYLGGDLRFTERCRHYAPAMNDSMTDSMNDPPDTVTVEQIIAAPPEAIFAIPYSMVSTVVEYEENRLLAWQTRGPGCIGKRVGGRIWRYVLEPVEGGTLVRETLDITHESAITKPLVRRGRNDARKNMAATLRRIEGIVAASS